MAFIVPIYLLILLLKEMKNLNSVIFKMGSVINPSFVKMKKKQQHVWLVKIMKILLSHKTRRECDFKTRRWLCERIEIKFLDEGLKTKADLKVTPDSLCNFTN